MHDTRMNRCRAVHARLCEFLSKNPDRIEAAATSLEVTTATIGRWLKGQQTGGQGLRAIWAQGFLEQNGVIPIQAWRADFTATESLHYALRHRLLEAEVLAQKLGFTGIEKILDYAWGDSSPTGWCRFAMEWELMQINTTLPNGEEMPLYQPVRQLSEGVSVLLTACQRGDYTVDSIAYTLEIQPSQLLAWFNGQKRVPKRLESAVNQLAGLEEIGQDNPSEDSVVEIISAASMQSRSEEPNLPDTVEESITRSARLLCALLAGMLEVTPPSQGEAALDAVRRANPDVWFMLAMLCGLVADPSQYPQWKKNRRK